MGQFLRDLCKILKDPTFFLVLQVRLLNVWLSFNHRKVHIKQVVPICVGKSVTSLHFLRVF